jgi:hypothetical protein
MDEAALKGLVSKWRDDAAKCRSMLKRYDDAADKAELRAEASALEGCAKTLETMINESSKGG